MALLLIITIVTLLIGGFELLPVEEEFIQLTRTLHDQDQGVAQLISINENLTDGTFFTAVNESALKSPTFRTLIALKEHFTRDQCTQELPSTSKQAAIDDFLTAIFGTVVLKTTEDYISSKGLISTPFREYVEQLWFEEYSSCDGVIGSSGFEHVFLGESSGTNIAGYHSWVSLYLDEMNSGLRITKILSYLELSEKVQAIAISFEWDTIIKPVSSLFIGSTPELEISLYTLASLLNTNGTVTTSFNNETSFDIQTILKSNTTLVYTAYPIIPF